MCYTLFKMIKTYYMYTYYYCFLLSFCITTTVHAQLVRDEKFIKDSTEIKISLFEDNKDGSVYTGMFEVLKGIQPVTYVGFAKYTGKNRPYALIDGEGKNGYLFEANLDQTFTIAQGRNGSSHFAQRGRIAVRYAPAFRMANDSSLPLIPTSQKIGLEVDYAIWNNYTKKENVRKDNKFYARDVSWINKDESFKVVHLIFNAMHYSNGQPPGVFYKTSPVKRHNYKKGDFSTNFLSLMAVGSWYTKWHRLFSAGIGYRLDGEWGDALAFNPAQDRRYGKHRLLGLLQYRTKPFAIGGIKKWVNPITNDSFLVRNKMSFRHRLELDYIVGNLDNFDRSSKARMGVHFYTEMELAKSRTIGFLLHLYYGRDYMNIRYDDIVAGGNIGFSFSLTKYKPPRQKSNAFIVSPTHLEFDATNKKIKLRKSG
jgi:hypothetical protein